MPRLDVVSASVPYHTDFAAVSLTLIVGFAAVLVCVNFTKISAPTTSEKLVPEMVTAFSAVAAAVSHVP